MFKGYRVSMVHRNQWLDRPDPYYAKIAGWKLREMRIMRSVLLAYDLVHDSGALSPAQVEKIDRDLVAYTRDYLIQGYGPGGPASADSLQDQGPSWWVLAACGALLGDRATLDLMVDAFEQILDPANGLFYEDGTFFQGSPAYQNQFLDSILIDTGGHRREHDAGASMATPGALCWKNAMPGPWISSTLTARCRRSTMPTSADGRTAARRRSPPGGSGTPRQAVS